MRVQEIDKKAFVYALMQVSAERFGEQYRTLSKEKRSQVEKIANKQCEINNRIFNSSEAAQVVVSEDQILQEVNRITDRFANEDSLGQELEANGLDLESFNQLVSRGLRVDAVMDYVGSKAEPCSEDSASLYYYMNPEKFHQPELREARHILITVNPDFPENERDAAFNKISKIVARLQKKPARFSEQAQKYSECPTAMNGGHLGTLKRDVLFPSLDKVLFELSVGKVSNVVESPLGFHTVMCESIQTDGVVPLSKALPKIIEKLSEKNRKTYQRNWLKGLFKT